MIRHAVRAVVVDSEQRVLLMRFVEPASGAVFWATPGGGLGPGEQPEAALRRELREELGLGDFEPGPVIWTRRHVFTWAGRDVDQRERFVLLRVPRFAPRPTADLDPDVDALRWWTLGELESSSETFAPRRLAPLLRRLLAEGPPPEPLDAGV